MDRTQAALRCQLDILTDWKERYGNITIDELRAFLSIATNPKQSQNYHVKALDINNSSLGRYMKVLGDEGYKQREGMSLTSQEVNPTYWREVCYSLTIKGKAVAQNMARSMDRYCLMVEESDGVSVSEQAKEG